MRRFSIATTLITLALVVFAAPAFAQTEAIPAPLGSVAVPAEPPALSRERTATAVETPSSAEGDAAVGDATAHAFGSFVGVVLGSEVNLRAGPSTQYEVTARLGESERLLVVGESFGWYTVQPEREVSAYVYQDLVELRRAGVGVVKRDRVNVRAQGNLTATVIGQVSRGDLVEVRGAEAGWVHVRGNAFCRYYIHRDFVRRTSDSVADFAASALATEPAAPAAPKAKDAADFLIEGRDLYLAELDKDDFTTMDFATSRERYAAARDTAKRDTVRKAAEAGLRRIALAERMREDFEARDARLRASAAPPVGE